MPPYSLVDRVDQGPNDRLQRLLERARGGAEKLCANMLLAAAGERFASVVVPSLASTG